MKIGGIRRRKIIRIVTLNLIIYVYVREGSSKQYYM